MKPIYHSLFAFALIAAPFMGPAMAQELQPEASEAVEQTPLEMRAEQVVSMINEQIDPADIFTDGFLAAVPPEQLSTISQQLTAQFGAALSVHELSTPGASRSALAIRMEGAIARGGIAIDPNDGNRISELLFQTFEPVEDDADKISADLEALSGSKNALFARLDQLDDPVFQYQPDTQLALGSAFKLYVLSALDRSINDGQHDWSEVVELAEKSFPSGQMQDWPEGSPVTLHTLASMMISISDNTATDQLIAILGADEIEAEIERSGNSDPSRTFPLLTTRQLFAMRGVDDEVLARYRAADDEGQRAILAALEESDVSRDKIDRTFSTDTPGAIDIEWFASPTDLAGLLALIAEREDDTARDIMAINNGLPVGLTEGWEYIGYKGGSEPGVLNLTWLLRDTEGANWILTTGWNNPDAGVDTAALLAIAQRILSLPR